jgi:hypothetical protein
MHIYIFGHERTHQLGDSATHPIERILTRLGALLHPWRFKSALRPRLPSRARLRPLGCVQLPNPG